MNILYQIFYLVQINTMINYRTLFYFSYQLCINGQQLSPKGCVGTRNPNPSIAPSTLNGRPSFGKKNEEALLYPSYTTLRGSKVRT